MRPGEVRLAVDYGRSGVSAVLVWPDGRWVPLLFDGGPVLSAAVLLRADGVVITGQDAWRAARDEPDRFLVAPLRAGTSSVWVVGVEVPVADLVAVTLRRVAGEAASVAGAPVADVRLVVPAGWGPRRRTWMRRAAYAAGLGQPTLVEAPVAVGEYLMATGGQFPVGAFLVVCDLGDGCEATVLRRSPEGFEVLSTLSDPDAAGAALDAAVTQALTTVRPGDEAADSAGSGWALAVAVRTAKGALSQHPAVTVPLPDRPAVVLTSDMVEVTASPVLTRAAQVTADAVAAAEIEPGMVAGVFCVGGTAAMPAAARAVGQRLGGDAVVVADPAFAAVRGAARVTPIGQDQPAVEAVAVPPVRRAIAAAVPGLVSLALFAQLLFTAEANNAGRLHYWVLLNWGELAVASVFAVLACLGAATVLTQTLVARDPGIAGWSAGGQVAAGVLAAVSVGATVAGLYAVTGALYLGLDMGPFLRWALLPCLPLMVAVVGLVVVALRRSRAPSAGWDRVLAFPLVSVLTGGVGMLLVQYSLTADRWPDRVLWIDLSGRVGGLLLGVGVVTAVVSSLVLRLVLGAPMALFTAVIVGQEATGVLGVVFCLAAGVWGARRIWQVLEVRSRRPAHDR